MAVDFAANVIVELEYTRLDFDWVGVAEQNTELLPHLIQGLANHAGLSEGAEIDTAILAAIAGKTKSRELAGVVDAY